MGTDPAYKKKAAELGVICREGASPCLRRIKNWIDGRDCGYRFKNGGEVVGVMPKGLFRGEIVHQQLTELIEVSRHA